MFSTVTARRLSVGTVYKLWFVGLGATLLPLGLLLGICALSGYNTVTWNGQPLHGVGALFAGPAIGLGMALLFTALLGSCAAFGLWLCSWFRPLSLKIKNLN
ncbi:hypothetical protein ACFOSS_03305 [Pseudaeromonas sharmana]|uniref:Transmembrane protein n=1 Tax=Pseudaeromonas sharmana TaxID=328412 RepID=A0ABV8CJZ3_9GAMM